MARLRCGRMMKRNLDSPGAPSISAASSCSESSDWTAVSRISVAKGSHCHATMTMIEKSGAWLRKS